MQLQFKQQAVGEMTLAVAIILFLIPKIKSKHTSGNILFHIFTGISLRHIALVFAECNCVSMSFSFLSSNLSQTHIVTKHIIIEIYQTEKNI